MVLCASENEKKKVCASLFTLQNLMHFEGCLSSQHLQPLIAVGLFLCFPKRDIYIRQERILTSNKRLT